jgi:hypothetical protein
MIARVLFVVNLHIAIDTINKLATSLIENVVVFIWGQKLSEAMEDKSNVSQTSKVRFA